MNAEKNRYFQELTLNLRHNGLTVKQETEDGLLPVEMDGRRLCLTLDTGGLRYWEEDVTGDVRSAALDTSTVCDEIPQKVIIRRTSHALISRRRSRR